MEACISIVVSILSSVAGKAAQYAVDPIARQVSYLFKHESKIQNLSDQLQKLKDARERVQADVNAAKRQGEEIFSDVHEWLTKVNGKICEEAAAQLDEDEENAKPSCFVWLCPNFYSRYQLSRKAEEEANTIAELLKDKDQFDRVSFRPALEGIAIRPDEEYEAFESRTSAFDAVMEALKDANLSIIGVYGMGGVGKTTLVKQVARQAKDENLFDEVVMAAVTQSFDIKKIQDLIADELDLKFEKQSDPGKAGELRNRLKKNKKVLVILDDIWVKLDMKALGIPYGGEHQGCKILLTSRELNALSSMDSQKNLLIDLLEEKEAESLFKKMAGDIGLSPDFRAMAIEVAKKCARLPIAIVTVGKAMKDKNLFEWRNALQDLRRPSKRNFEGILADVYSAIDLSYNFLKVREYRLTFLLCSIMGHDAAIEDLLKYGMGLGLFDGVNTIEETRNRVYTLVSNLKSSSLLFDGSTFERFDMHDVIRDVAISIASRDHHWLARDDVFKELSNEATMRNCELISLQSAKVCELLDRDQLGCPNLTFFSLGSEDSSLKISSNFFRGMQRLKVLDFAKIYFPSLPLSFCFLKNLHTLCFSACMLKDTVIIGELKNLEILSLRKSKIAVLPGEIGQLIKLKLLDLSDCYSLKVISPNVLSRLSRLEELYLYNSFDRWEVEGHEKPRTNASLVELQHLSHLTTLEVHIRNLQAVPKELFSEKFERYKISIGEKWLWFYKSKTSRDLKLKLNKSTNLDDSGVKTLLRKTEALDLDAVKDVRDMLYDPNTEGFPHLKHLDVSNDSEVKYLINSMELASCKAFPLLETLFLRELKNLEAICYGQLQAECFGRLRIIKVERCNILKNMFSLALARKLGQLQEIEVSNCVNFTELIVEKREEEIADDDILEFSQLRFLRLKYLPSFIGLFNSEKMLSSSQQGRVQSIEGSSTATSLFDQKVLFPGLKYLRLQSIKVEKLWHDQLLVTSFGVQNLTNLAVHACPNLKNLFTSSMVESFVQLKTLVVGNCNEIEEVITVTEGLLEEERMRKMTFSKLDYLMLSNLPNLKRFCFGNPIEFPSLRELKISRCPSLNTFHSDSASLGIIAGNEAGKRSISMVNPHTILSKHLFNEKIVFPGLEELEVCECDNLKNLFTSSMVESFVQLKTLVVGNCNEIEELIIVTEGLVEEERMRKMVFPKLDYLELRNLSNLKRFCCGNSIEFPSLRELKIVVCPVLNTFHFDSTSMDTIVGNEVRKGSISMENLRTDVLKYLFNEKVVFPVLDVLHLSSIAVKNLWHEQLSVTSIGVQNLTSLFVNYCHNLKNLFTSSMVERFVQLKALDVGNCNEIEEIIIVTEGLVEEERMRKMVFPKLDYLGLWDLPNLKRFCFENSIEFPSLTYLNIEGCPILNTVHSDSTSVRTLVKNKAGKSSISMENLCTNVSRYLFNEKLAFPNLQQLELGWNDGMKEILHGQLLASDYFCKLKVLRLKRYPQQLAVCPSFLFQLLSLPNLESLEIEDCYFKELVFQSEGVGDEEKPASASMVLSRLTELRLSYLDELMHLWKEKEGFQNLRILHVERCPKLETNLVPSSVCFQNLMTLEAHECNGIIKLVTHSTAKSLVQLREMKIIGCGKIEEIVEGSDGDRDEGNDEIIFPKLNLLELSWLSNLESFCSSGNHTFGFPSLATLVVDSCPKMKMFCQGGLNAPMLHKVDIWLGDWIWEGSLNRTIQKLYKERNPVG